MRNRRLSTFIIGACVMSLLIALSFTADSANAAPKVFRWKVQGIFPPGDLTNDMVHQVTLDSMEKASGGRLVFQRFTVGALASDDGMLDAVGAGGLDMAIITSAYYTGTIPEGLGFVDMGIPFSWQTPEDAYSIYYEHGLLDLMRGVYANKFNAYDLGPAGCGRYGLSTNFPVTSLADLKGKKIRAVGINAFVVKSAGGAPVYIPGSEIYMALKLGTVDAIVYSYPELETLKYKEVLRYVVLPPWLCPPISCYLVNMDRWNALPDDLKKTLEKTVRESFVPLTREVMNEDEKVFNTTKMTVDTLSPEDAARLKAYAIEAWDSEIATKGPLGAKAVKIIKDYYSIK
jgi:TRAP-type C4-dicarboxylate transport system substrate-binding protein